MSLTADSVEVLFRREKEQKIRHLKMLRSCRRLFILVMLSQYIISIVSIEPISTTTGLVAAGSFLYYYAKCKYIECCEDPWVRSGIDTINELEVNLTTQLYGQPFVKDIVYKAVKAHVTDSNPTKALVMSFHGGPGTGKNHVSEIIARALFKKGTDSEYFLRISAIDMFPEKDEESLKTYRAKLKRVVRDKLSACKKSLIVIDEVDKMPEQIVDIISPFFDYSAVGGVDGRQSIFLFLSNTGSTGISNMMYKFWTEGKTRSALLRRDMESMINKDAFNELGGFRHSHIMADNMIDHYIPFLPLERKHIKLCAVDYISKKYGTSHRRREKDLDNFVERVADEIEYVPPDTHIYARNGCKRVSKKVDILWHD